MLPELAVRLSFRDFGLACFSMRCRIIGYLDKDGQDESLENYMERMSGLIRLYASIIQSIAPIEKTVVRGEQMMLNWQALTQNSPLDDFFL